MTRYNLTNATQDTVYNIAMYYVITTLCSVGKIGGAEWKRRLVCRTALVTGGSQRNWRHRVRLELRVSLWITGYGDITPQNNDERAFAIMLMVVGGGLFGYVRVEGCVPLVFQLFAWLMASDAVSWVMTNPWYMLACGTCWRVVHVGVWYMLACGTCWPVIHVGLWYTLACGTCWRVVHVGMWYMLACGTCWRVVHVGVWCMLACGTCWRVVHVGVCCMLACGTCWRVVRGAATSSVSFRQS